MSKQPNQNPFQIFSKLISLFLRSFISVFRRSPLSKKAKSKKLSNQKNRQHKQSINKIKLTKKVTKFLRSLFLSSIAFFLTISLSGNNLWFPQPAYAGVGLYVEPITFDEIGLDSNNVNVGPNSFLSGARVCNTSGGTLNNIGVTFVKLSTNDLITVTAVGEPRTQTINIASLPTGPLPPNPYNNGFSDPGIANITPANCFNAYYNVVVQRTSAAYDSFQKYRIEAAASGASGDTNEKVFSIFGGTGVQQLYVEKILSQARNSIQSFSGPTTVYVGGTYEYTLITKTATAYPQLTVSSNFPNAVFQFLDIKTSYSSDPTVFTGSVYNDACGWIRPSYFTGYHASSSVCNGPILDQDNGDGKVGNTVTTRYRIKILASPTSLGAASNTVDVYHLINDFSGGSYHYNADYGSGLGVTPITILEAPDLTIAKSAPSSFTVGVDGTYTLTVTNSNVIGTGSTIGATVVQDTLPAGMTFQGSAPIDWACKNALGATCIAGDQGTLTFTNSALIAKGASSTITLTVRPTLSALVTGTTTGSVTNTATVSTPQDTNTTNNSASVTSPVYAPDLKITKTGATNVTQGQNSISYTLSVQNIGPGATSGTITVTDTLPSGITPTAASGLGWDCSSISGQIVTCTRSDPFAAGTVATPTNLPAITITANVTANATIGTVTNTARVSAPTDPIASNNRSDLVVTIASLPPNLEITKTSSGSILKNSTGTYVLAVKNLGGAINGSTVTVSDILPTGVTYNSFTSTGWSCTNSGQVVTCTRSDSLASGASYPNISLNVTISSTVATSITNYATVSVAQDTDLSNNTASYTSITDPPDLIIKKEAINGTDSSAIFTRNATHKYKITVTNAGGTDTTGLITVADNIQDGGKTTFSSFTSASSTSGWICETTGFAVGNATNDFTCRNNAPVSTTYASLAPGQSATLVVSVVVPQSAGGDVTNTISVSGGGEVTTTNNSYSTITPTSSNYDLTVQKSHTGNFTAGSTGIYTIIVKNAGTGVTSGTLTLADTLLSGLTFNAITGAGGGALPSGWGCTNTATSFSCTNTTGMAAGASSQFQLTVNVASNASSPLTNTATIASNATGGNAEVDTSNNIAIDPTVILTSTPPGTPDLLVRKTGSATLRQGETNTYTLTVQNVGTAATNTSTIYVTDTVPSPLTLIGASGTGWDCNATSGQTVSCNRNNSLAVGSLYPDITVTVAVPSSATLGPVSPDNIAQVSGNNVAPPASVTAAGGESNIANNRSQVTIAIQGLPDLTISKSDSGNFVQGGTGGSYTYTLTVTNSGSAATTGQITVTDNLPTGITASLTNYAAGNSWTCNSSGQTVTCTNNTVILAANGGNSNFAFPISIAANPPTSVTNEAIVSGGGETNTTNNTAYKITPITLLPDLQIFKSHTGNFTQGQIGATYTLTVANIGTGATNGTTIKVSDTLPTFLTPTAASGSGWDCSSIIGQIVTCTRTDVLAGNNSAYPDITITVDVDSNATTTSSIINTATVSGTTLGTAAGGESTFGSNNTANDPTTINPKPITPIIDVEIKKTHTDTFTQGDTGKEYILAVKNVGTAIANGTTVTVTDTLPIDLKATSVSGPGWTCDPLTLSFGNTVTCRRTDGLALNAAYENITLTVSVATNARAQISNIARVSVPGDVKNTNDYANDPTDINQLLDLKITKTAPALVPGQNGAIYTLTITNKPAPATSNPTNGALITVIDTLPTELTAVDPDSTNDNLFSVNGWDCSITNAGKTVTCTRSDILGVGNDYPVIPITVNVASNATSVSNTATVSGGKESFPSDNTFTVVTVSSTPKLVLVKRITAINGISITTPFVNDPTPNDDETGWPSNKDQYLRGAIACPTAGVCAAPSPNQTIEYTIYFLSNGTGAATNVTICDLVPANTTFVSGAYNLVGGGSNKDIAFLNTSTPTTPIAYLTALPDSDRGNFYQPNVLPPTTCKKSDPSTNPPTYSTLTAGHNTNGLVVVDVAKKADIESLPPAPDPKSYGFVRFTVKVN